MAASTGSSFRGGRPRGGIARRASLGYPEAAREAIAPAFAAARSCGRFFGDAADRCHPGARQSPGRPGSGVACRELLRRSGLLQIRHVPHARPARKKGRTGRRDALPRDASGLRAGVEVRRRAAMQPASAGGVRCAATARGSGGGSAAGSAARVARFPGQERIPTYPRLCDASLPASSSARVGAARPS